ncbi:hypothetical protein NE237_023965 [Protea cynaroides]|uniref:Uncharacterized protein n=1 Tax=Protea cynaroides TaxID=273540 RepID=A0A9Q0HCG7_9MAGN|nr:hypothetical protein NE237_023965 [Protea cynaroides]
MSSFCTIRNVANLSLAINALYSIKLLITWNSNCRVTCILKFSGLVKMTPAPECWSLKDPSTNRVQVGEGSDFHLFCFCSLPSSARVLPMSVLSSAEVSSKKSASTWALTVVLDWNCISNSPNLIAQFTNQPEMSGRASIFFKGLLVSIDMVCA